MNNVEYKEQGKVFKFLRPRIIWIVIVTIIMYVFVATIFAELVFYPIVNAIWDRSAGLNFIVEFYAPTILESFVLYLFLMATKRNSYIWYSFLPALKNPSEGYRQSRAQVYAPPGVDIVEIRKNNKMRQLGYGLLIGFIMNFTCILCALVHGDIKLYFDFALTELPLLIFAFVCTFIQSTTEELWCRGFMYERLSEHYPLWVAIVVNGALFGALHMFNPGVGVIPIVDIVLCGLSFSLLRWYTDSIWTPMAVHTAWNFTQNFLFGLPNSGLVSELSVFHLGAANGINNLIYNYDFGVEGAIPGVIVDFTLGAIILYLGYKKGRLHELTMSKEKVATLAAEAAGQQH